MRCVAFDSKDFSRARNIGEGKPEGGFFTPLGVGVVFDDPDKFTTSYIKVTAKLSKEFEIGDPSCIYSSSMLKNEIGLSRATVFSQKLVDAVKNHISLIHFTYVILPPSSIPEVSVGGDKCVVSKVKTEDFLRNLGPMFSYISAWNYKRYRKEEECKLIIDAFSSKETAAWKELVKFSEISVVSHGDEVNPLISFADIIASLTDIKLYNAEVPHRGLTLSNLKNAWKGTFEVDATYIDGNYINKIKWTNKNHIDYTKYMIKPTLFFISDEVNTIGINEGMVSDTDSQSTNLKKGKRLMEIPPVKNAINLAALKGYSFRFYDPNMDLKYVRDGDIIIWMGEKSRKIAEYLEDGFDVRLYRAKDIKREISGLHDH